MNSNIQESQISDITASQTQSPSLFDDENIESKIDLEQRLIKLSGPSPIIAIKTIQHVVSQSIASQSVASQSVASQSVASQSVASQSIASQSSCNSFDNILQDLAALSQPDFRSSSDSVFSWGVNTPASQPEVQLNSDSISRHDDDDDDITVASILSNPKSIASIVSLYAISMYLITHGCYEDSYTHGGKIYSKLTYQSLNTTCIRLAATGSSEWETAVVDLLGATSKPDIKQIYKTTKSEQPNPNPNSKHQTFPNSDMLNPDKVYGPNHAEKIQDIDTGGNYIGLLLQSVTKTLGQLFDETIFVKAEYRTYCISIFAEAFYPDEYNPSSLENISITLHSNTNLLGNPQFNLFCYLWNNKDQLTRPILSIIRGRKYGDISNISIKKRKHDESEYFEDISTIYKQFNSLSNDNPAHNDLNGYEIALPTYTWPALRPFFITNSLMKNEYGELIISLQIYHRILESQVICFLRDPDESVKVIDMACSNAYTDTGEEINDIDASQIHAPVLTGFGDKYIIIQEKQPRKTKTRKTKTKKTTKKNNQKKQKQKKQPRKTDNKP